MTIRTASAGANLGLQSNPRAAPAAAASVSVIVPAFREAENIPELVRRVESALRPTGRPFELIIVDDASDDGTEAVVAGLGRDWVRLLIRRGERGLSSAVIFGCGRAQNDIVVVMDADLSHPPEAIGEFLGALDRGADFVLGSRYVPGGSTDSTWGVFRAMNSRVATILARPFTSVRDPMSGFFALRRSTFLGAHELNPIGYKIGLELLVKCGCRNVREVPIHFADRTRGQSKLRFSEQVRYMRHIGRLWSYRMGVRRGTRPR